MDANVRETASEWHGGQFTALYAFSSSGTITEGLEEEIESCLKLAKNFQEILQLRQLLDYVREEKT